MKEELAGLKKSVNAEILRSVELTRKADSLQRLSSELEYRNRLLERSSGAVGGLSTPTEGEEVQETAHNESRI